MNIAPHNASGSGAKRLESRYRNRNHVG